MIRRSVRLTIATAVVLTVLTGCSGKGAYCDAISDHEATLTQFGAQRTDKDFKAYAETAEKIAQNAPKELADEWKAVSQATRGVVTAHDDVGVKLADMRKKKYVQTLDPATVKTLNAAYEAFNDTAKQRQTIVRDTSERCGIELTPADGQE